MALNPVRTLPLFRLTSDTLALARDLYVECSDIRRRINDAAQSVDLDGYTQSAEDETITGQWTFNDQVNINQDLVVDTGLAQFKQGAKVEDAELIIAESSGDVGGLEWQTTVTDIGPPIETWPRFWNMYPATSGRIMQLFTNVDDAIPGGVPQFQIGNASYPIDLVVYGEVITAASAVHLEAETSHPTPQVVSGGCIYTIDVGGGEEDLHYRNVDGSIVRITNGGIVNAASITHDHPASDIISGTFNNARISEGNVTQHEAALTITESQISDLAHFGGAVNDLTDAYNVTPADKHVLIYDGVSDNRYENRLLVEADISDLQAYLTAEVNDLSAAVTWATVPDAYVSQSSVTQHQAALSIAETQIPDGSLLARVGSAENITATWQFRPRVDWNHTTSTNTLWTIEEGSTGWLFIEDYYGTTAAKGVSFRTHADYELAQFDYANARIALNLDTAPSYDIHMGGDVKMAGTSTDLVGVGGDPNAAYKVYEWCISSSGQGFTHYSYYGNYLTSGTKGAGYFYVTAIPSSASTSYSLGAYNRALWKGSANSTSARIWASYNVAGTAATPTGNLGYLGAVYANAGPTHGANTYTYVYGLYAYVNNAGASTTISKGYALYAWVRSSGGGTITDGYGLYVDDCTDADITNAYAIYVNTQDDSSGATRGNIYFAGGNYNTGHVQLDTTHMWHDNTNSVMRFKGSAPSSETDGFSVVCDSTSDTTSTSAVLGGIGAGPSVPAQDGWLKLYAGGTAVWVPYWT